MTSVASNEEIFFAQASVFRAVVERVAAFGEPWIKETRVRSYTDLHGGGSLRIEAKVSAHVAALPGLEALLEERPVGSTTQLDVQYRATSSAPGPAAGQGLISIRAESADAFNSALLEQSWVGKEFFFQFKRMPTQYTIRETRERFEVRGILMWTMEQAAWVEEQLDDPRCELIRV